MPFLADLDEAPRSRSRGLILGALIAVPLCIGLGALVLPRMRAAMLSAAADHDRYARERDAYMLEVCGSAINIDRDETLCGCVLATEYPGLDCLGRFSQWLVERQSEACAQPATFEAAPGFCSCVTAVKEATADLEEAEMLRERQASYARCRGLGDALGLPELQGLASRFDGDAPSVKPRAEG